MKIWDMATEKPIQTLSGHTDEVIYTYRIE
jgi:hypothetical protein